MTITVAGVLEQVVDESRKVNLVRALLVVLMVPFVAAGLAVGALVRVVAVVAVWALASAKVGYRIARGGDS